jgi:hypothetical protein
VQEGGVAELRRGSWSRRANLCGFAFVGLAGVVLVIATFLPWISVPIGNVESDNNHSRHDFSGWELAERCGEPNGLSKCTIGVPPESRQTIVTGRTTLVVGVALAVLGVCGLVSLALGFSMSARVPTMLSFFGAGIIFGYALLFAYSSGKLTPQLGLYLVWGAAAFTLAGASATALRARRGGALNAAGRALAIIVTLVLGFVTSLLLWGA